jgi:hypothetical protein
VTVIGKLCLAPELPLKRERTEILARPLGSVGAVGRHNTHSKK